MDFLQQKEELENKLKNINNYWDDLKIKQEEKFKKREEYKEPKKHLYDAIYKILYLLKSKICFFRCVEKPRVYNKQLFCFIKIIDRCARLVESRSLKQDVSSTVILPLMK